VPLTRSWSRHWRYLGVADVSRIASFRCNSRWMILGWRLLETKSLRVPACQRLGGQDAGLNHETALAVLTAHRGKTAAVARSTVECSLDTRLGMGKGSASEES